MDQFVENLTAVKSIRSKLLNLYMEKINGISSDNWKNIKKFKFYFCLDFSMNKIVKDFEIPRPIQVSGSEEVKEFEFTDKRRLLCYLLLGSDFKQTWKNTKDAGIGEPLYKDIVEKIKEVAKSNECDLFKASFEVKDKTSPGNYSLKLVPFVEKHTTERSKSPEVTDKFKSFRDNKINKIPGPIKKEFKSSLKSDKVQILMETKETHKSRIPMDKYITPDTIVAMTSALEAIAEVRNKSDLTRSEKASIVIKLCQLASDLIDGHDI